MWGEIVNVASGAGRIASMASGFAVTQPEHVSINEMLIRPATSAR